MEFHCLTLHQEIAIKRAMTCPAFPYCFSPGGDTSHSDFHVVPRHGERLRDENQHVRGHRRDGQSLGVHGQGDVFGRVQ